MAPPDALEPIYRGRVIDGHCHVASTHFVPLEFLRGSATNLAAQLEATGVNVGINTLLDVYIKANQDHDASGLLAEMDQAGIEKTVLLLPDFTHALRCELTIAEMFERQARILAAHPGRFEVFAGVDPRWGADGLALFERGVREYGFRGLKLYPPCGYTLSDRVLYPFYELCDSLGIPVLAHTGPTSPALRFDVATPLSVDGAAHDFPNLRFILAHAAGNVRDMVQMCGFRPNVFADISGFLGMPHPKGWKLGLREFFSLGVNHKLIFGTDFPVFKLQGTQDSAVQRFVSSDGPLVDIPPEQRAWIMHGNIERLLRPPRERVRR